jgi:hypothetical protein
MEYGSGVVAINPSHTKLITALRTAVEKGEGTLDKEATSHDDLFDAFRMSLLFGINQSLQIVTPGLSVSFFYDCIRLSRSFQSHLNAPEDILYHSKVL